MIRGHPGQIVAEESANRKGITAPFGDAPLAGDVLKETNHEHLEVEGVFTNGASPHALMQGRDGYFYGTTVDGGTNGGHGTVFRISSTGALTSLHSFSGINDGANPLGGLVQGGDGFFYGTTEFGGLNNVGTVFKISINETPTTSYAFSESAKDGANPVGRLVQGSDGTLYGTTARSQDGNGTVFKISADGTLVTLHFFTGTDDGAHPVTGLVQGDDGKFYGTTADGGRLGGWGTVFKISAAGALTILYTFTGNNDGENPQAELVLGTDGKRNDEGLTSDDTRRALARSRPASQALGPRVSPTPRAFRRSPAAGRVP